MGSPFKMKPKTPLMKALVGKQGNLPQHLQDAIKAAPEKSPAKSYGKSPMKKTDPAKKSKSKNPHTVGTEAYAKFEKKNKGKTSESYSPVTGKKITEEKKKEYANRRAKSNLQQAYKKNIVQGTGQYEGYYRDRYKGKWIRGTKPSFEEFAKKRQGK